MDKSWVTMEQKVCLICCKKYETGTILMDKRMKDRFERHTTTGWGVCPEHQAKLDEGFVAFIGCDPEKSTIVGGRSKGEDAHRTGSMALVRREVAEQIFDMVPGPVNFCDEDVMKHLELIERQSMLYNSWRTEGAAAPMHQLVE